MLHLLNFLGFVVVQVRCLTHFFYIKKLTQEANIQK